MTVREYLETLNNIIIENDNITSYNVIEDYHIISGLLDSETLEEREEKFHLVKEEYVGIKNGVITFKKKYYKNPYNLNDFKETTININLNDEIESHLGSYKNEDSFIKDTTAIMYIYINSYEKSSILFPSRSEQAKKFRNNVAHFHDYSKNKKNKTKTKKSLTAK